MKLPKMKSEGGATRRQAVAFGGLNLMQYLAVKLKATSPTRKRRKKRKGK